MPSQIIIIIIIIIIIKDIGIWERERKEPHICHGRKR